MYASVFRARLPSVSADRLDLPDQSLPVLLLERLDVLGRRGDALSVQDAFRQRVWTAIVDTRRRHDRWSRRAAVARDTMGIEPPPRAPPPVIAPVAFSVGAAARSGFN